MRPSLQTSSTLMFVFEDILRLHARCGHQMILRGLWAEASLALKERLARAGRSYPVLLRRAALLAMASVVRPVCVRPPSQGTRSRTTAQGGIIEKPIMRLAEEGRRRALGGRRRRRARRRRRRRWRRRRRRRRRARWRAGGDGGGASAGLRTLPKVMASGALLVAGRAGSPRTARAARPAARRPPKRL